MDVQVVFEARPLELDALVLPLSKPAGVGWIHVAALGTPLVENCSTGPAIAAYLLYRHASISLLNEVYGLFF